ncbi:hypothetical protein [Lacticaseibacillus sharpeae]|uniref:Uncharacterized protein n=1 Tax=Lacticaseibacillus sharpeae JCM 1186 = DSM 20505 TaxID=1291052 RepID=A0A0R1ZRJ5_9LACO|nr:hypothetical protein [Lacticaseibacillus sharpeae]KRM54281.1 hypothetical protein FC18_GL000500 [Lacticaseibacillus sharpeae JCM 1186 = DSM 20505]
MLQKISVHAPRIHIGVLEGTFIVAIINLAALFVPDYLNFGYSTTSPSVWQILVAADNAFTNRFVLSVWPLALLEGLLIWMPLIVLLCVLVSTRFTRIFAACAAGLNFTLQLILAVCTNRMVNFAFNSMHVSMQHVGAATWLCVFASLLMFMLTLIAALFPDD